MRICNMLGARAVFEAEKDPAHQDPIQMEFRVMCLKIGKSVCGLGSRLYSFILVCVFVVFEDKCMIGIIGWLSKKRLSDTVLEKKTPAKANAFCSLTYAICFLEDLKKLYFDQNEDRSGSLGGMVPYS